jgi:hypothetical protein
VRSSSALTRSDNFGETLRIDVRNAGQRSARSCVVNCYRDQAVTNARQLADLLSGADASVVGPGRPDAAGRLA